MLSDIITLNPALKKRFIKELENMDSSPIPYIDIAENMVWACNILTIEVFQPAIVVHQVNCRGIMSKGLALQVKTQYPSVYKKYRQAFEAGMWKLGMIQPVTIYDDLTIINLAAQDNYVGDKPKTNLNAHRIAWPKIRDYYEKNNNNTHLLFAPLMIGAGLGGGDPREIIPLVEKICPEIIWVIPNPIQYELNQIGYVLIKRPGKISMIHKDKRP